MAAVSSCGTASSFFLLQQRSSKSKSSSYSITTIEKGRKEEGKRFVSLCLSSSSTATSSSSPPASEEPLVELEFLDPKPQADGAYQKESAVVKSGEKLLRNIMNDNKIELYAAYGKVMNCGGTGSCGTCIVEIIDGQDLLNERTNTEKRYLKKKPGSWRLACQTIVGNKENSGKVIVQRLPQWKKCETEIYTQNGSYHIE